MMPPSSGLKEMETTVSPEILVKSLSDYMVS
jgi:hypothetical protein